MDFTNNTYVVSGASSGIGKSCVELLLEKGAFVVGVDIGEASISDKHYSHYTADIRDEQRIIKLLDETEARHHKIDGLVNSAGVFANAKPFYELTIEDWNRVLSTNLTGTFLLTKHVAIKMIKERFGRIVNISCIRSKIFRPNMVDYAASKGGVAALTSAMALDLQEHNIRVNAIAPGFVYTEMTAESFDDPGIRAYSESLIPVGRIAEAKDIAKVTLFLLSDAADYINGETIFVDGGFKLQK